MQFAFYKLYQPLGNINDSQATNTNHEQRENLSVRASLEIVCIYTFQNSYFFQCLSWYLWILSACWLVTLLLCALCAVSLLIMTWHYKRLLNASKTAGKTPTSKYYSMYASEQVERWKFSHFCIQYLLFLSLFLLVLQIFCRYNITFNREILGGGGDDSTGHSPPPPPKILGRDISPIPPPPPGSTPMV